MPGKQIIVLLALMIALFASGTALASVVPDSAENIQPLLLGAKVPNAVVRDTKGKEINLADLANSKPTIIIFYRGGWCPYCNVHLHELKEIEGKLVKLGYQILAISPDRPSELEKSFKKHSPKYTLLSDSSMAAAKGFGIAFRVSDDLLEKYKKYNIDLEASSGTMHHLLPVPSVFIVGADRTIRFKYVNPDYKVRLKKEVLFAAAEAYMK